MDAKQFHSRRVTFTPWDSFSLSGNVAITVFLSKTLVLVLFLTGSGQLNNLDSERQIHRERRRLLDQKRLASVQRLSCQP